MYRIQISDLELEFVQGDIVGQPDLDAIVNAANAELRMGGGVAGVIHRAAGPELEKKSSSLAPLKPGEAVITDGYQLENDFVIHTLGPVYGVDKPEERLLAKCYQNSLKIAEKTNIESIGFPAISTGAFNYPIQEAAAVSLQTVKEEIYELKSIKLIRFILYNEDDYNIYKNIAEKIFITDE
ncbi:macro domain-containing protein [Halanaerobium hydrogeniformans]|uniref:Appr-1-p processing domain protein n=1 Tax=Halanaerobium hydrogeniformans TaxID=656519 RepID=E4RK57_HALHG|nr:macro domain-containing protein [Halanaerobium hydrogeniformans]ADQ14609.1 Appr-1-p processing domain protein [Halanaerobium hydrogeniformans]